MTNIGFGFEEKKIKERILRSFPKYSKNSNPLKVKRTSKSSIKNFVLTPLQDLVVCNKSNLT